MNEPRNIVVAGASAGGLPVIVNLLAELRADLDAAVFIVMHLAPQANIDIILKAMQSKTKLHCLLPHNNHPINAGCVYLAPPNHHLFIEKNKIRLTSGPAENLFRPSIDVTFRSAAAAYASRVTGIILTGLLYDGTAGMEAIKKSGGVCIVQDPKEAEFDTMPASVLSKVDVDYQVSASDIPFILEDVFARQAQQENTAPPDVMAEADLNGKMASEIVNLRAIGEHSNYTCPECGGNLWRITTSRIPRYRCHIGHAYEEHVLLEQQMTVLTDTLWVSVRMAEEQRNLLLAMAQADDRSTEAAALKDRADQIRIHIERLKAIILTLSAGAE